MITGVGIGLGYNPSMTILSRHFNKYNKVAVGLSMCGVGISSFAWPPVMKALEDAFGWRGATLMIGGIYAQTIVFTSLYRPAKFCNTPDKAVKEITLKHLRSKDMKTRMRNNDEDSLASAEKTTSVEKSVERNPINGSKHMSNGEEKYGGNIVLLLLRNNSFSCFCLHYALFFFPLMLIYTHFGSYVLSVGCSKNQVMLMYMTMGIVMTVARALTGIVTGLLNLNSITVVMVSTILIGVVTLAVPFIQSVTLFFVYSVLFCLLNAPTYVLCLPIVMESVPTKLTATAFGIMSFISVPASILGAPLAGKVL